MQPNDPDALTPRERQVLDLVKRRYSNRDIAAELGISLSGAKYHVSEIISKLGVATREEAAAWRPERERRWMFVPTSLSARLDLLSAGLPFKLIGLVVIAAGVAIATAFLDREPGSGSQTLLTGPVPTPTIESPCPTPPDPDGLVTCVRILHVELASWDEASALGAGDILEPAYVPPGFERDRLIFSYSDSFADSPGLNTAVVSATFIRDDGSELLINQGLGPSLLNYAYDLAPEEYRGSTTVGSTEVRWVNGNPIWEQRNDVDHATDQWDFDSLSRYTLTWEEPKTGPIAWEKSPEGDMTYHRTGQAAGYLIHSNGLPLEELIKVAESMLAE
jgi:DNA-binding CsgD family transcriptional regulator